MALQLSRNLDVLRQVDKQGLRQPYVQLDPAAEPSAQNSRPGSMHLPVLLHQQHDLAQGLQQLQKLISCLCTRGGIIATMPPESGIYTTVRGLMHALFGKS